MFKKGYLFGAFGHLYLCVQYQKNTVILLKLHHYSFKETIKGQYFVKTFLKWSVKPVLVN